MIGTFDIFDGKELELVQKAVSFNTDSLFDFQTGMAERGVDGKWYLSGGFGNSVAGVCATSGYYKSTFTGSMLMRIAAIYGIQGAILDSEDAISRDRERVARFAGEHATKLLFDRQVKFLDGSVEYDVAKFLKFVKDIGEDKRKHKKALEIETPFVSLDGTGAHRMMAPTFVFCDSLTEMHSSGEEAIVEEGIDTSKAQTAWMVDGAKKTSLIRWLKKECVDSNIIICCTAHYDKFIDMSNTYGPTPKSMQFQPADRTVKGVGSRFKFLTSPQLTIESCKVLQDDTKQCYYRNGDTNAMDVNELMVKITRCKNNNAGTVQSYLVSQTNGYLEDATNYNYTKVTGKMFGLAGNAVTCQHRLVPDVNMTRNSMRGVIASDYKLHRAFQLTSQLLYLQRNWNANEFFPHNIDVNKFCDFIMSSKDPYTKDLILNSRGYWLPKEVEDDNHPYFSIMDILELINNNSQTLVAKK